jgi:hypothetical protein
MKICIDGFAMSHLLGTGLYTYTYELLNNLFTLYPQPTYKLLCDSDNIINEWYKNNKLEYLNLKLNRKENNYSLLENFLEKNKVDLYHSPNKIGRAHV